MKFAQSAINALSFLALVGVSGAYRSPKNSDAACSQYVVGTHNIAASAESVASLGVSQVNAVSYVQTVNTNVAVVKLNGEDRAALEAFKEELPAGTTFDCDYEQKVPETDAETGRRLSEGSIKKDSVRGRKLSEQTPFGITMVEADQFSDVTATRSNMKICVVDTGYDEGHIDLPTSGAHGVDGFSPYSGQFWNNDGHGHGSHCAGTIGAIGGNDEGVTSCNPDPDEFTFYIGKGLNDSGSGSSSGVMSAVQACVEAGAKVVSMSLGGGGFSQTFSNDYKAHYNSGVLIVAAAGNGGNSGYSYPASYTAVMSVAAVDSGENKAGFSQYNDQVEIAAPGVQVLSTLPNDSYAAWSGTSMACPHVAGVAGLVWSYFPDCEPNQIRNVLLKTAKDKSGVSCDVNYGFGIVKAKKAYELLAAEGCTAGGPFLGDGQSAAPGGCKQIDYVPPPTPAPTQCDGSVMELEIIPDSYPEDISWELLDGDGDEIDTGGPSDLEVEKCLPPNDCYTFTIKDSWGDGLCCAYGEGGYTVTWDGVVVAEGGDYDSSETSTFGNTCDGGTGSPTQSPTQSPTDSPTASPTTSLEDGFVRISAFQANQKERKNDKLKTTLFFAAKDDEGSKAIGAVVHLMVHYHAADGSGSDIEKYKTCTINDKGRCSMGLKAYDPQEYSHLNVTVSDVEYSPLVYNPEENKEKDGCPLFSPECIYYTV